MARCGCAYNPTTPGKPPTKRCRRHANEAGAAKRARNRGKVAKKAGKKVKVSRPKGKPKGY